MGTALLIARIGLALVFAFAAVTKLADRDRTAETLGQFGVPDRLLGAAAIALPLAELAVAALLVCPRRRPRARRRSRSSSLSSASAPRVRCGAASSPSATASARLARSRRPPHAGPQRSFRRPRRGYRARRRRQVSRRPSATSPPRSSVAAGVLAPIAAIAFQAWFSWQLFRQNGRLVARVGSSSARLPAKPPLSDGVPRSAIRYRLSSFRPRRHSPLARSTCSPPARRSRSFSPTRGAPPAARCSTASPGSVTSERLPVDADA